MISAFTSLLEYIRSGGFIMVPLTIGTFVLWYTLGYRYFILRRGSVRSVRVLFERYRAGLAREPQGVVDAAVVRGLALARAHRGHPRRVLDDAFGDIERELRTGRVLIRSVVAVAPLAGLLGTVTGMIETFDSLADMSLFSQSGGVAGGISQALFTTQMGLSIAVPGLLLGQFLDRRQALIQQELDQLKDMLATEPLTAPASDAASGRA
ncbi:MAG TPA: MotA/TolQ/ExbB proton channel family protein [Polyangiaceae bacterium]